MLAVHDEGSRQRERLVDPSLELVERNQRRARNAVRMELAFGADVENAARAPVGEPVRELGAAERLDVGRAGRELGRGGDGVGIAPAQRRLRKSPNELV